MSNAENEAVSPDLGSGDNTFKMGIYLQEKKSTIGTGGTAKTAEYRTFWVTLRLKGEACEMLLLDDDFKPTGIRETFTHAILSGAGWYYIAEGEKRYQRLLPHLERLLAPKTAAAKPAAAARGGAASGGGNWWGGGEKTDGPPKDPFAREEKPAKPNNEAPKKGGWWE